MPMHLLTNLVRDMTVSLIDAPRLMLPVLLPSWRFFASIAPSPRIEFAICNSLGERTQTWRTMSPTPDRLSVAQLCWRLIHNTQRNEDLYLVSCAENLIASGQQQWADRIANCLRRRLHKQCHVIDNEKFCFRLVFVVREGDGIERHECYVSASFALSSFDQS